MFVIIENSALYASGVTAVLASSEWFEQTVLRVDAMAPLVVRLALLHVFNFTLSQGIDFFLIVLQIRFQRSS